MKYACPAEHALATKKASYPNAIKVEPKENGPLYVEMHFYMRVAKERDIEEWKKAKAFKNFGMPVFRGSGSFEYKSNNYRFLVTDRLGRNLQTILEENSLVFPLVTVLQIGIQVVNILEYIHSKGYIHGDIKASNLLLGLQKENENTVYIVDFGLAAKCTVTDNEFSKDPRKVNNGTLEYISRDGHIGVFGFRGDLEILGFNLIHWVNGSLPWQKCLTDPKAVEQQKIELMNDPKKYIKTHLPKVPVEIIEYMEYMKSLNNNDIPDYEHCRNLFMKKLKEMKCASPYSNLCFTETKQANNKETKGRRKVATEPAQLDELPAKRRTTKKKATDVNADESPPAKKNARKIRNGNDSDEEHDGTSLTSNTSNVNGNCNSEEEKWKAKSSSVLTDKRTRSGRTRLLLSGTDKVEPKIKKNAAAAKRAMTVVPDECELKDNGRHPRGRKK